MLAVEHPDPDGAIVLGQDRSHPASLEHLDARMLGDERAQLADQPAAGGGTTGVDDPPRAMAALEPEREPTATVGVETHAEPLEVLDSVRRFGAQDARGGFPRRAPPGFDRVGEVAVRAVVGRQGGRETPLRPVARGAR